MLVDPLQLTLEKMDRLYRLTGGSGVLWAEVLTSLSVELDRVAVREGHIIQGPWPVPVSTDPEEHGADKDGETGEIDKTRERLATPLCMNLWAIQCLVVETRRRIELALVMIQATRKSLATMMKQPDAPDVAFQEPVPVRVVVRPRKNRA